MKRKELQELISYIAKSVLKEYNAMSASGKDEAETNSPSDSISVDELPASAKAKIKRDKEIQRRDQIKQKEKELDVAKKEMDFQKQKLDQSKRFNVPNLTKDIQQLKGSKI